MVLTTKEEILELPGNIQCHHWHKQRNEIIALIGNRNKKLVRILADRTMSVLPVTFSVEDIYKEPNEIILSDDGDHIVLFTGGIIRMFSWAAKEIVATLKTENIGKKLSFHKGDFLNTETVWIRAIDYNNIYLLTWNWKTGNTRWTSLEVDLKIEDFPDGFDFSCFRLEMHPSKRMFLGIADFDHGGYQVKIFYLLPPEGRQMRYIHLEGLEQEETTNHTHAFNDCGDKIAGAEPLNTDIEEEYLYEVRVYRLEDLTIPFQRYKVKATDGYIQNLQFLVDDNFLAMEFEKVFRIVDMTKGKSIYQRKKIEGLQLGPGKSQICMRHKKQLIFLTHEPPFAATQSADPVKIADDYIERYKDEIRISLRPEVNCYPKIYLVPKLQVYYAFYSTTFDLRTKEKIDGDLLPEEAMPAVVSWFNENQAAQLKEWEEMLRHWKKYVVKTSVGNIEFYPYNEKESRDAPGMWMVFKSKQIHLTLTQKPSLYELPEEVNTKAQKWLASNFDWITAPWKDNPQYYSKFRVALLGEEETEPEPKPFYWDKKPKKSHIEKPELEKRGFWELIKNLFR